MSPVVYEYREIIWERSQYQVSELNQYGFEGWRIITVLDSSHGRVTFLAMREKQG